MALFKRFKGQHKGSEADEEREPSPWSGTPPVRAAEEQPIKSPPMEIDGRVMTAEEFVAYIEGLEFPEPLPTRIFLHHTWKPTRESWRGYSTILAMKRYYERQLWRDSQGRLREGWTAGPHLFVADDGIWLFSDIRYDGVGVYGHNYRTRHLEMVGNYDAELPSGPTLHNTIVALGILHEKLGLDIRQLCFHRDFSSKSCPGWAVRKEWIIPQVEQWIAEYRASKKPPEPPKSEAEHLREALRHIAGELLVDVDPQTVLTAAAEQRGLLGPLTREIPMEIEEQGYIVQFFAEVLLVPVNKWDEVQSLAEFESTFTPPETTDEGPSEEDKRGEDEGEGEDSGEAETGAASAKKRSIKAPPSDPFGFTGQVR